VRDLNLDPMPLAVVRVVRQRRDARGKAPAATVVVV
jgi:hypothetical protein